MAEPVDVRLTPAPSEVETAYALLFHEAWRRRNGGTVALLEAPAALRDALAWLELAPAASAGGTTPPLALPALAGLPSGELRWFREQGFLPEALTNHLLWLGYETDRELFDFDEFVTAFEPERIRKQARPLELAHLERLNRRHAAAMDDATFARRLEAASPLAQGAGEERLAAIVPLVKGRLARLTDFDRLAGFLFAPSVRVPHDALIPKRKTDTNTAAVLRLAREAIAHTEPLEPRALEARLRTIAEQSDWTAAELYDSLRWAVAGQRETLPLLEALCLLGKASCIERIDAAIDVLGSPENPILGPARPEA